MFNVSKTNETTYEKLMCLKGITHREGIYHEQRRVFNYNWQFASCTRFMIKRNCFQLKTVFVKENVIKNICPDLNEFIDLISNSVARGVFALASGVM